VASSTNAERGAEKSRLRRVLRPLRSAEINPAKHGPIRRFFAVVGSTWDLAAYVYLLLAALASGSRKLTGDVPVFLQSIHAVFPLVVAPAAVVLGVSILRRRAVLVALSALLCLTGYLSIAPARKTVPRPSWVQGSKSISVLASNVYFQNTQQPEAARMLLARNADVVTLTELTESMLRTLDDQGFADAYPHRATVMSTFSNGAGVFSKYPFRETRRWGIDRLPDVDVTLPSGEIVRILTVHPLPPLEDAASKTWNTDLRRLKGLAKDNTDLPFLAIGDFNGTRWQPRFGSLLVELDDAHEVLGKGLSTSWPMNYPFPRFVRIDHALFNQRLFPTGVADFTVPGSDHRAFVATFAVRPPAPDPSSPDDASSTEPSP
jgi:endonuclease/exonuclease/phosphatase (EEP) superfamily protein YafD